MRSPAERAVWVIAAAALVVCTAAAWWTSDQWLPHAKPWAQNAWRTLTRPGPETLPKKPKTAAQGSAPAPEFAAHPRRCVQDGHTLLTDQPCPPGSQEQPVGGR